MMKIPFADQSTLLFIGDSITDCGRGRPVGQRGTLGSGYVALVDASLSCLDPARRVRVLNVGISGNRVIDLADRWESDVLDLAPDWLSVMIGINDVWRQFDNAMDPNQVDLGRFEEVNRELLTRTRPRLQGLVLMTPFYLETNRNDSMRKRMDQYSAVVRQLADEFNAHFVDVQSAYDDFLQHRPTQSLCGDRVHPNLTGHLIIARAFLQGCGIAESHTLDSMR